MAAERTAGQIAAVIAENFIRIHGKPKFLRLLELISQNASGAAIAKEFDVTRQRAHQWKRRLGTCSTVFHPYPEVEALISIPVAPSRTLV